MTAAYGRAYFGAVERVGDHLPVPAPHRPRQRLWKIVARQRVLAAGAIERPIVFGGNDRPGVMMASAVRTYVNRYGVAPGRRAAIFTSGDDGWRTAADLVQAGVAVEAVIDSRPRGRSRARARAARRGHVQVLLDAQVIGTAGLAAAVAHRRCATGDGRVERFAVDLLAVSGGWNPTLALSTHLGGEAAVVALHQRFRAGRAASRHAGGRRLRRVRSACPALSGKVRRPAAAPPHRRGARHAACPRGRAPRTGAGRSRSGSSQSSEGKAFVDFQHDVTREDVVLAAREGFRSVEHLKRYTTLGMATDQGKTSNVNGLAIMAALTERSIPSVGTTTARPPVHADCHGRPRRSASRQAFPSRPATPPGTTGRRSGAPPSSRPGNGCGRSGSRRPANRAGKIRCLARSAPRATSVGVCDVSTLGKIDIQGADAGTFLDRVYINMFSTLPVGKARYGLMLREDGFVMDDGTTAQIAKDHYVMSTTTANAAGVMQHLEHARQMLWPELDVQIVSVTEQWAQYAIAGPNSRRLLERLLGPALDVSDAAFPYLACAEFSWRNCRARLFRISFSGEMAYELAVPARYGDAAIRAIMSAGEPFQVSPYGIEALGVMRIEKGHVAGNELNGTTTAADLGLGRMMSKKKDFIGRVLAERSGLTDPERPALVGIRPVDRSARLYGGAHFLALGAAPSLENDQGYLTSVAFSPMLGHWIGLGFLKRGPERHGERLRAFCPIRGGDAEVEVVSPLFFDPEGGRLHV